MERRVAGKSRRRKTNCGDLGGGGVETGAEAGTGCGERAVEGGEGE